MDDATATGAVPGGAAWSPSAKGCYWDGLPPEAVAALDAAAHDFNSRTGEVWRAWRAAVAGVKAEHLGPGRWTATREQRGRIKAATLKRDADCAAIRLELSAKQRALLRPLETVPR